MNPSQKAAEPTEKCAAVIREQYYSAEEFGKLTGFTAHTIRNWCRKGILDHVRLGSNIRIPVSQLKGSLQKGGVQ